MPIPGKVEGERAQPSRPLPVLAPRSALELLPSRALSSAWADDPRRHSRTACKQVFAGLDLLDHLATLRHAPDFPERPKPDFPEPTRLIPTGQDRRAPIEAMRGWYREHGASQWRECTTAKWRFGESGLVGLPGAGGFDFLLCLPPWIGQSTREVVASNKPEDVPVSMTPEVVVEGRVIDPKGMPVVGAQVAHAASPHEVPTLPEWARTITDPQGRFRLVLMPSGPSDLIVVDHNGRRIGSLTPSGGDTVLHRR